MSSATSGRTLAGGTPSFSFGRFAALVAGTVVVGVEAIMTRAELSRSRRDRKSVV